MNYYSLFLTLFQFLQKYQRTQNEKSRISKKPTVDSLKPEKFPPTEEKQKYIQLMEILKPYHDPKYTHYYC